MLLPGFDVGKAAQVVAFLALKAGGNINVLKLSKLVYLAEREFMARYDTPMFYDKLCSMPDGPVASITLNLINGNLEDATWSAFVSKRQGFEICAADNVSFGTLDRLSKADVKVLDALWDKFGQYDKYALRDWTHKKENIPEWKDPLGSSIPIHHEDVFRYLKKDDSLALSEDVREYRRVHEYLGEHPFIGHPSYALYRLAEQKRADAICNGVSKGYFIPKDDMSPEPFRKICAGLDISEFVSPWAIDYFARNKDI